MRNTLKIALVFYFLLLALAVYQLRQSAPDGYESSLYSHTPPLTWAVIVLGIVMGVGIIAHRALSGTGGRLWLVGFLLLAISNAVVIALPALRGYYASWMGDPMAHFGMIHDVLTTGHFWHDNTYPMTHVFVAQLTAISGLSELVVVRYVPAFMSVLYMLYVYLLGTVVLKERGQKLMVAAASGVILLGIFQATIYPHGIAHIHLVLIIYLYFKSSENPSLAYRVPFFMLLVSHVFFHGHSALVLTVFLATMELSKLVYRRVAMRRASGTPLQPFGPVTLAPAMVSFMVLFVWFSSFGVFANQIKLAFAVLTGALRENPYIGKAQDFVQLDGWQMVEFGGKSFGPQIFYFVLSVIALILMLKWAWKGEKGFGNAAQLAVWCAVGGVLSLVLFFAHQTGYISRLILLDNWVFLTPVFVGFVLFEAMRRIDRGTWLKVGATAGIILAVAMVSDLGVHRSGWVSQLNSQVTAMDASGSEWLLSHHVKGQRFTGLGFHDSFPYMVMGFEPAINDENVWASMDRMVYHYETDIPPHFGYPKQFGDTINHDMYVVMTERFERVVRADAASKPKVIVPILSRFPWEFDEEDLQRLEDDSTVNKLYAGGEMTIYHIAPSVHWWQTVSHEGEAAEGV